MADTKVSDLNSITVAGSNDILYIVNPTAGTSNKITYANLFNSVNTSITTLTNTVDLFTAEVIDLSGRFIDTNNNLSPVETEVREVSANVFGLSGELDELSDDLEATIGVGLSQDVTISGTTLTFLSGVLTQVT